MDVCGGSEGGAGLGRVCSAIEPLLVSIASSAVFEYSVVIASSAMVEKVQREATTYLVRYHAAEL